MNAVISAVGITLILVVVLPMYNRYRVDYLRTQLFAIRDELFDSAARGEVSFDSKAYQTSRTILNGMIRFAHKASVLRMFMLIWFGSNVARDFFQGEVKAAFDASPKVDRDACANAIMSANVLFARHYVTSPLGFVIVLPFAIKLLIGRSSSILSDLVTNKRVVFETIDREAYREGREKPIGCAA